MPPEDKIDPAKKQTSGDPKPLAVIGGDSVQLEALGALLDEGEEQNSKRSMGPRKRFELALPIFSKFLRNLNSKKKSKSTAVRKGAAPGENERKDKSISKLRDLLSRPIAKAAEQADLDVADELDWQILTSMLAWSIYGGKGPGRGKMWSDDKLKQLLMDLETVRLANPHLKKEEEICKFLCSRKSNFDQYQDLKSPTLRRRLQDAKNLKRLEQKEAKIKKRLFTSR
jgi:hypothetical protein